MAIALSVLDQSPIASGRTARDAFDETIALAQLADRLGYRRYWLAEHHNTRSLAGSAPEIMIARVAAETERIRVGSGGVMLQHYSPLKVAENFRVLQTLYPGRIDLGIGRAPGSDQRTAYALAQGKPISIDRFPEQLRDLAGFLHDDPDFLPDGHPYKGVHALPHDLPGDAPPGSTENTSAPGTVTDPSPAGSPEIWLLGSSNQSATYAAHLGFAFSFAHFINPHGSAHILEEDYRQNFRPSPELPEPRANLAVRVLCAETDEEARRLASSFGLGRLRFHRGEWGPLPSVEEALAYPYSEVERAQLETIQRDIVIGSPETVKQRLEHMAIVHRVDELVIVTLVHDPAARQRSYQLLAEAFELKP
jgi:luciferase family oxidoreductase group 1